MGWFLAIALLIAPLIEIALFVQLDWPLWLVLGECSVTAGVGFYFSRGEDWTLWTELESEVQNGRVPASEAVDALLKLIGAWGLMVPGLITDLAGAALLVPPVRAVVTEVVRRNLRGWIQQ